MLADFETRTLDLANRLHDMTYAEWGWVKYVIDKKFEIRKRESERQLQLSFVEEKDI